jgi:Asp-tRNA(Asn)/Glu-tRNA(Gln) amidotransferase C subunit
VSTIRGFLRIGQDDMSLILDKCKLQHLKLTKNEYKKASALKDILEPFEVLNEKLQGEYFCTISMVAPAVFELEAHLDLRIEESTVRNSVNKIR